MAGLAVACAADAPSAVSLVGTWTAGPEGLPPEVVRANINLPLDPPVIGRGLRVAEAEGALRWCLRDVRDGEDPAGVRNPCACPAGLDCSAGTLRMADTLVADAVLDVTLDRDDARADLVGVLALFRGTREDVLAVNVKPVDVDPGRRADAATGLQGPLWSGADGLGWYRRVVPENGDP